LALENNSGVRATTEQPVQGEIIEQDALAVTGQDKLVESYFEGLAERDPNYVDGLETLFNKEKHALMGENVKGVMVLSITGKEKPKDIRLKLAEYAEQQNGDGTSIWQDNGEIEIVIYVSWATGRAPQALLKEVSDFQKANSDMSIFVYREAVRPKQLKSAHHHRTAENLALMRKKQAGNNKEVMFMRDTAEYRDVSNSDTYISGLLEDFSKTGEQKALETAVLEEPKDTKMEALEKESLNSEVQSMVEQEMNSREQRIKRDAEKEVEEELGETLDEYSREEAREAEYDRLAEVFKKEWDKYVKKNGVGHNNEEQRKGFLDREFNSFHNNVKKNIGFGIHEAIVFGLLDAGYKSDSLVAKKEFLIFGNDVIKDNVTGKSYDQEDSPTRSRFESFLESFAKDHNEKINEFKKQWNNKLEQKIQELTKTAKEEVTQNVIAFIEQRA